MGDATFEQKIRDAFLEWGAANGRAARQASEPLGWQTVVYPRLEDYLPAFPPKAAGPYSIGSDEWPGLSKLIEEAGEMLQIAGKIIAIRGVENYDHWDGTNLKERMTEEAADLLAALEFFCARNLEIQQVHKRAAVKRAKFEEWHLEQSAALPSEGEKP
jgi:NTP pyrophosphatase (non-canonical NTP hydrolase)